MSVTNDREFNYSNADFESVRRILYKMAGINLTESKRQLVYSRLARRLRALKIKTFANYLVYLDQTPGEQEEFINALTTNLTAFFRESHHFEFLKKYAENFNLDGKKLRVWCAAASTGEEPYSIAMTLAEAFGRYDPPVEIIASDIDSNVLQHGALGVYTLDRLDSLSEDQKKQFFMRGTGANEGKARVIPALRKLIRFEKINLLDTALPLKGYFDVIFCRNVMIYFDKDTQLKVLERMLKYLQPNGIYIAGHSESFAQANHLVKLIDKTTYTPINSSLTATRTKRAAT